MVDTGILFNNMKSPYHECQMTFWPFTNSDFTTDQTFHQFHDLDTELYLYRIISGFHGAFAKGVACLPFRTHGSVPLFRTWLCSNFLDQIPQTCHVFTPFFTLNTPWYCLDFALYYKNERHSSILEGWLGHAYVHLIQYFTNNYQ